MDCCNTKPKLYIISFIVATACVKNPVIGLYTINSCVFCLTCTSYKIIDIDKIRSGYNDAVPSCDGDCDQTGGCVMGTSRWVHLICKYIHHVHMCVYLLYL